MTDKRIKDLTNTAAESDIASGNYFVLDGSAGTKKLNSTTLLELTAQNALAGNVAPAFDPTRTSDNPYKAGEVVANDGKTYIFKSDHYGAWSSSDVLRLEGEIISMRGLASVLGIKDANNAPIGSVIRCQTDSTYSHFPQESGSNLSGNLLTFSNKHSYTSQYVTQMFFDISGAVWIRFKQYGGSWTSWSRQANAGELSSLSISFNNKLLNYPKMSGAAVTIGLKDANNALPATFYWVQPDATYSNFPEGVVGGNLLTLLANISVTTQYVTQMFFDISGNMWVRFKQYGGSWTSWSRQANANDMAVYAGLKDALNYPDLSMFQRVGVVGDSYASAALYTPEGSPIGDVYPLSWPQILGRKTGCTWINFTQGGLSTRSWLSSASHGLPALLTENPCDLYILVLGINDTFIPNYLGSLADITSHESYEDYPDTFYGNYGKIFEQIIEHAPAAKIIFSTMSNNSVGTYRSYNEAIVEIAEHYNVPIVKQFEDGFFSSAVYTSMYGQHPTKAGQAGMATAFERMIQKSIVSNLTYYNSLVGE